jgi:gliding motility-associated-like protein
MVVFLPLGLFAQNCPIGRQTLSFNDSTTFDLDVFGVINNNLAAAGQGVCDVKLQFLHNAIGDFEVWLTSPSGQTVQLIGPNSTVNYITLGSTWNVDFTRCSSTPNPDPPYQSQWDNNINRFAPGNFSGTYLPYLGCLENFNTGPVNGIWKLKVKTSPTSTLINGRLLSVNIVFCDRLGQRCCFADPGVLPKPRNISVCVGDNSLNLSTKVTYQGAKPDSTLYGYLYAVGRNQALIRYDSIPDLRNLPAGNYQVCGLSYLKKDKNNLPPADGKLLLDTLRKKLVALNSTVCGQLSDSCFQITILPRPDTAFVRRSICEGDSLLIGGKTFKKSGRYYVTFDNPAGCDSLLGIDLTVGKIQKVTLDRTLCFGDSLSIGSQVFKKAGTFTTTLRTQAGCDSIITLNLKIRAAISQSIDTVICQGSSFQVGNQSFSLAGTYRIKLTSATGCDSLVQLILAVDTPRAVITGLDTLTCTRSQLVLDGSSSLPKGKIIYRWEDGTGNPIGNQPTFVVKTPGAYFLQVITVRGKCANRNSAVQVFQQVTPPRAVIATADTLSCKRNQVVLNGSGSTAPQGAIFKWSTRNGRIASGANAPSATVDSIGDYQLLIFDPKNGCADSISAKVVKDVVAPIANAGKTQTLTCTQNRVQLDGSGSSKGSLYVYQWTGACIIGVSNTPTAQAGCEGTYRLLVTNRFNGCSSIDSVLVNTNANRPRAIPGARQTLTCKSPLAMLNGGASTQGPTISYRWRGPGTTAADTTIGIQVSRQGRFTLIVTNRANSCLDSNFVVVTLNKVSPDVAIDAPLSLNCNNRQVTLGSAMTSVGSRFLYDWSSPNGRFASRTDSVFAVVRSAGMYRIMVTDTINGCSAADSLELTSDQIRPAINFKQPQELTCGLRSVVISATATGTSPRLLYLWKGPCIKGDSTNNQIIADCAGRYQLQVTDVANGCINIDTVRIKVNGTTPNAVINANVININCLSGTAIMDGGASTSGTLKWLFNGQVIGNLAQQTVTQAGIYQLIVENTTLGCSDTAEVKVVLDCTPKALVLPPDTLTCTKSLVKLDGSGSTLNLAIRYQWLSKDTSCFVGSRNQAVVSVKCGGLYSLVVTNINLKLSDTVQVMVIQNNNIPVADAGLPDTLRCNNRIITLDGQRSTQGLNIRYFWIDSNNDTLGTTQKIIVKLPGQYILEVLNSSNGCLSSDGVVIARDAELPEIRFGTPLLPCGQDTFLFRALVIPETRNYQYRWQGPKIWNRRDSLNVNIGAPGVYILTATDLQSNCVVTDTINIKAVTPCKPCIGISGTPAKLTCAVPQTQLKVSFCDACPSCKVQWTTLDGRIVSGDKTLSPTVNRPGTYRVVVIDSIGLKDSLFVKVIADTLKLGFTAAPFDNLTCIKKSVPLFGNKSWIDSIEVSKKYTLKFLTGKAVYLGPDTGYVAIQTGLYKMQVTSLRNGCSIIDSTFIGLDTLPPNANAGLDQILDCVNQRVTLDGSGSSLGAGIRFQWQARQNGRILAGAGSVNPVVDAPGVYQIRVTDSRNGCSRTDEAVVSASTDLPTIVPIPNQNLTCRDTQVVLRGVLPVAGSFRSRWCALATNGDSLGCSSNLNLNVKQPGSYVFELTNTLNGCKNRALVQVGSDRETPQVDAGAQDTIDCKASSLTLQPSVKPFSSFLQYRWTNSKLIPIVGDTLLNASVLTGGVFVLTVSNKRNGCSAKDSVTIITDNRKPLVDAGLDTATTCARTQIRLNGSFLPSNINPSIQWTANGGQIVSGTTALNPVVSGSGIFVMTIRNPLNGCFGADAVRVGSRTGAPNIQVVNAANLKLSCLRDTITLNATSSTSPYGYGLRYFWIPLSGAQVQGNPIAPTVIAKGAGIYRLLIMDIETGCQDSLDVQVNANKALPRINLGSANPFTCIRKQVIIDAGSSDKGKDYRTTWKNAQGQVLPDTGYVLTVNTPGKYLFTLFNQLNGCNSQDSILIQTDTTKPIVNVRLVGTLGCDAPTVDLNGGGSQGRSLQYLWTSTTGGGLLSGAQTAIARANAAGSYLLSVTDGFNGCSASKILGVTGSEPGLDRAVFTIQQPGCIPANAGGILIDSIIGGVGPYTFFLNNVVQGTNNRLTGLAPGDYVLKVEDRNGCAWSSPVTLKTPSGITVELGPDREIRLGDTLQLKPQTSADSIRSYRWSASNSGVLSGLNNLLQRVSPLLTTTYSITVTASNGCIATDFVTVKVVKKAPVYIPTAFSPNGDGVNDVLTVFSSTQIKKVRTFQIYDRWGTHIYGYQNFQPNDPTFGWDGTFQGIQLTPGVFVYYAEVELANGTLELLKGEVMLVR